MKHLNPRFDRIAKHLAPSRGDRAPIADNWVEFAATCQIRSGSKLISFVPYSYQQEFINLVERHPLTVCVKGRQLGLTETISNYALFQAARNPAFCSVFISKGQQDSSLIARRLRATVEAHDSLELATDNLTHLQLVNGGQLLFRSSAINAVRGINSLDLLVLDEASFIANADLIYGAAVPAMAMAADPKIVVLSTPDQQSGFFFDLLSANNDRDILSICEEVRSGKLPPCYHWEDTAGNAKIAIHWKAHPIYSQQDDYLKRVQEKTGLPAKDILREFDLSFVSSSGAVFNPLLIRESAVLEDYQEAEQGDRLFIGIDPNFSGSDYFAAVVLKETNGEYHLIRAYRRRGGTSEYHVFNILKLLDEFNPYRIAVEVNGGGIVIAEQLAKARTDLNIEHFRTSRETKQSAVSRLLLAMEQKRFKMPNKREITDDFVSFRREENGKMEAASGKHDDVVMASAIALSLTDFGNKPTANFEAQIFNPKAMERFL